MKTGIIYSLALSALLAGGSLMPLHADSGSTAPQRSATTGHKVQNWANAAALKKSLTSSILNTLKGVDEASVQAFLSVPENRLMLAQWQVLHCEGPDEAKQSAKEGEPPRTFKDVFSSADKETLDFLNQLTSNPGWMEQVAYTGECIRPGRVMAILSAIAKRNKGIVSDRVLRDVATATALEWARSNWNFDKAIDRAEFYIRNHKAKRFHKGFKSLPFWQYRVICGSKGDNANGSVASLEWGLDNVHLPIDQYPGACWYSNYLSDNLFGDSIHGNYYYAPYNDVYGENALQRSRDIGGVCGSLSHFGAFAAVANGVPAMPAGEPGHCAYIVCVNGRWVPSYSLSWERGLHWQVWNGIYVYSSLHMASELYSPDQVKKTAFSNACRTLGQVCAAAGKKDEALACFRAAVKAQPCNFLAWSSYTWFLQEQMPDNAAAWKHIYKEISKYLASKYPEMAAELLKARVHANLFRACPSAKDRLECYNAFWKSVEGMGPDRWAVEAFCNAQADSLKDPKRDDLDTKLTFYKMALSNTAGKAAYAPIMLAWGNAAAAKADEKTQQKFFKATLAGLSKGSAMEEGARDKILNQAVLGAERMRDRSSFQAIGKMLAAKYRKNSLPKWDPFPGKLLSENGMMYASSTCQHDWPSEHWGVLQTTGGRFHTNGEKDAWVVVELPKMAYLTGVVTVATSNLWRLTNMKVQYSETGKDGDWHDAGAMPKPTEWQVNRLDLQQSKPRARFIRIVRPGGPEVFQLNGIFVYGNPAA